MTEQKFLKAYEEHADALFRYCFFRISDRELARDLLQETFMRAWQTLEKGADINNLKAFLYKVAKNLVIDEYRKKKTESLDSMMEQGFDVASYDQDRSLHLDGEKAIAMLSKIPEKYREVIFMRYVEELSVKEIAEAIDESENNTSVRLHRGIEKLRELWNHE